MREVAESVFGQKLRHVLGHIVNEGEDEVTPEHLSRLIFGDFMIPDAETKTYDEVRELTVGKLRIS